MKTQEPTRKTAGGIVSGEADETRRPSPSPKSPAAKEPKGRKLAPSRMPRRDEATDKSIGKGDEPVRPREE